MVISPNAFSPQLLSPFFILSNDKAKNLADGVAAGLISKYGVVLGEGKIVGGEMAHEDPVASLFGRYFTVRTGKRKIDHSWNVGELEHTQKDAVIEYLQMPERVKKV